MATRYVGIGGNDGNSGLTWALRKLTLNGVEDTPVVAGDLIYVGPGAYREKLIVDVSGGAGTEIVYVGDVTGEHTDGVGGIARVTGSDNDQAAARDHCIEANDKDYRTFRGFLLDSPSNHVLHSVGGSHHWIVEDCAIYGNIAHSLRFEGVDQASITIRRNLFISGANDHGVSFRESAGVQNAGHVVENCVFAVGPGVVSDEVGGIAVRNCAFLGSNSYAVRMAVSPPVGYTAVTVENCIIRSQATALRAAVLGEVTEDYNTFWANSTDRTNVAVGGNSVTYPPLLLPPILHAGVSQASGFKFPWWFGVLSEWSQIRALTGSNEPSVDLLGIVRPVTASKNSWGAIQFHDAERDTGTVHAGNASIKLADAGRVQIKVPVTATSTTISVYVYREANYAGNLPQMIIKQPGQADDITTDANAASQWNLLTTTLTPAASPSYVIVELVSRNTVAAGNYDTFFDDLEVS